MGEVRLSGPLFDDAASILDDAKEAIRAKVAEEGQKLVRSALTSSIRIESTGRAVDSITITEVSRTYSTTGRRKTYTMPIEVPAESTVVTSSLATYSMWLEGSGSRNATTRFKGYHYFQTAAANLNDVAGDIAQEAIEPYIAQLNGG